MGSGGQDVFDLMKSQPPTDQMLSDFEGIKLRLVAIAVLAAIPWFLQIVLVSFSAKEFTTQARLRTVDTDLDDSRILRVYQKVKGESAVNVEITPETNPKMETRDSWLLVHGKTKAETISGMKTVSEGMITAYAKEGKGEIYVIDRNYVAKAIDGDSAGLIRRVCDWTSILILLAGLVTVVGAWRRAHLPKLALLGLAATIVTAAIYFIGGNFAAHFWTAVIISAVPVLFFVLLTIVTVRVQKAASWLESRARITRSTVKVVRHRFSGDTTKVRNEASITYEFPAGSKVIKGDRISLGFGSADPVDVTLKRYPKGAEVSVFYNPDNPADCVLERDSPASFGCLWSGYLVSVAIYGGIIYGIGHAEQVNSSLHHFTPTIHHPLLALVSGSIGLLGLVATIYNRRHPKPTVPWISTKAAIVSSNVESYMSGAETSRSQRPYYKAVVEYCYRVEDREYHQVTDFGGGMRSSAEADAARYPKGMELEVSYNSESPSQSKLGPHQEVDTSSSSLVIALILIGVAIFAAFH
jgi:hypothetical protein